MKILICDFGGTSIKYQLRDGNTVIKQDRHPRIPPQEFLKKYLSDVDRFVCTGGSSLKLPDIIEAVEIVKIPEFEAMAYSVPEDILPTIVTSAGTGIPIIRVDKGRNAEHVAGTSIGGGTLTGLARLILGTSHPFEQLEEMALTGDSTNVNLTVGDIVGSGIGYLPAEASASYFAKGGNDDEDQIAALFQMVAENLAILIITVLLQQNLKSVYMIGRLASSSIIESTIRLILSMRNFDTITDSDPEFALIGGAWNRLQHKSN